MAATYRFGDVVQIDYPFADLTGEKQRPAVVVSSDSFCQKSGTIIAVPVTGSTWIDGRVYGTVEILDLSQTDLTKPSVITAMVFTVKTSKILRRRGVIDKTTRTNLLRQLREFFPS